MNDIDLDQYETPGRRKSVWRYLALRRRPEASRLHNEISFQRAVVLLLNAIEAYAIPIEHAYREQFSSTIRRITDQFTADLSSGEALAIAGQACATLKRYCERTNRFLAARKDEYTKMVAMFTETLASVNTSGEYSIKHLQEIEKQIQEATVIEDVRTYRHLLGQCLGTIREEIKRQEFAFSDIRHLMEPDLDDDEILEDGETIDDQESSSIGSDRDPVTGLPSHQQAESAIIKAATGEMGNFVVAIVIGGIERIYPRLGAEVGDSVMFHIAHQLRSSLGEQDELFRWRGSAFVALLKRTATITEVRRELSHLSTLRLDDAIRVGARRLWLPISVSFKVIAATPPYYSIVLKIDRFIATESRAPNHARSPGIY